MVACAESHTRVNHNVEFGLGDVGVETAVDNSPSANDYRFEIMLLPLGIPVLTWTKVAL